LYNSKILFATLSAQSADEKAGKCDKSHVKRIRALQLWVCVCVCVQTENVCAWRCVWVAGLLFVPNKSKNWQKKKINVYKKLAGRRSPQSAEKGKV